MGNSNQRPKSKRRMNTDKAKLVEREEKAPLPQQPKEYEISFLSKKSEYIIGQSIRSLSTKVTDSDLMIPFKDSYVQERQSELSQTNIEHSKEQNKIAREAFIADKTSNSTLSNSKSLNYLRQSFFTKLQQKGIWQNQYINSSFNCIYIYDWDDTLMFTSEFYLKSQHFSRTNNQSYNKLCSILNNNHTLGLADFSKEDLINIKIPFSAKLSKISEIKNKVYDILSRSIELGDVFIVTNASKIWVETCCFIFYPEIYKDLLSRIKIISAREEFEKMLPIEDWKKEAFLRLGRYYSKNIPTNIIVVGDSEYEIESVVHFQNMFDGNSDFYCKTVKFKEKPSYDLLNNQLELFSSDLDMLNKKLKSVNIVMGKVKKQMKQ